GNFGGTCGNFASNRINAINWLMANTATKAINVSTGGSFVGAEGNMVRYAHDVGMTVCGAAGNSGSTTGIMFPAGYPTALGIGALTSTLARASYSQAGDAIDFAFPGSGINSSYGASSYASKSGTS